eukprot:2703269-Amphidinium_carterae.1
MLSCRVDQIFKLVSPLCVEAGDFLGWAHEGVQPWVGFVSISRRPEGKHEPRLTPPTGKTCCCKGLGFAGNSKGTT